MNFKLNTYHPVFNLCIVLILLSACSKQDPDGDPTTEPEPEPVPLQYPDHIVAGIKTGDGIVYSGSLGIEIHHGGYNTLKTWDLDLNNDSIYDCIVVYDIFIEAHGWQAYKIYIKPRYGCSVVTITKYPWVDTIPANMTVDESMNWYSDRCIIYDYFNSNWPPGSTTIEGLWKGVKGKYIGIRSRENGNHVYGWIRIELDKYMRFKIIDYACTTGYSLSL